MKAKIPPSLIASYISLASLIFSDHLNNLISLSSRILDKSPGEWGVNDWDMYYIKKVPETTDRICTNYTPATGVDSVDVVHVQMKPKRIDLGRKWDKRFKYSSNRYGGEL
ncbi:unnamed protein product [Rhizophagus irregularis]|uniref:Uncharacterized protein n=1 Tax=Rhizophagus irregularis TaxID=588596 RepID=A0A915Z9W8_9GLOM|nr:unnamed protein product [Rhizophagus irregularis]